MKPVHPENASYSVEAPPLVQLTPPSEVSPSSERSGQPPALSTVRADSRLKRGSLYAWLAIWIEELYSLSFLSSALFHSAIVLALATLFFVDNSQGPEGWLQGTFQEPVKETLDLEDAMSAEVGGNFSVPRTTTSLLTAPGAVGSINSQASTFDPLEVKTEQPDLKTFSMEDTGDLLEAQGGGLSGRTLSYRQGLVAEGGRGGPTAASESAVELGLQWLAEHQAEDGGWRFNLESLPQCNGACRHSGFVESTTGSTGLALLCFLGAGYTQHEGPYQDVVARGIYYLMGEMAITSKGGDLRGLTQLDILGEGSPAVRKSGDMYSHGIATLALCEAYAMTGDKNVQYHAQQAVDFIVYAQHSGGGWRYELKEPGDTTVSGWQVAALKSGLLGDLQIPRDVWYLASDYLDSVQDDRGATYGYQRPQRNRPSTSAVGLLCRMMLGWPKEHDPLLRGAAQLAKLDPVDQNMYFNYYATQVLHHVGGNGWAKWNPRMRDHLVRTQVQEGHERGSWWVKEAWSDRGGRLYTTAMSILTLEVYYRYLPMYGDNMVEIGP